MNKLRTAIVALGVAGASFGAAKIDTGVQPNSIEATIPVINSQSVLEAKLLTTINQEADDTKTYEDINSNISPRCALRIGQFVFGGPFADIPDGIAILMATDSCDRDEIPQLIKSRVVVARIINGLVEIKDIEGNLRLYGS